MDLSYKKADIPGGSEADRKVIHNHGDTFKYARELSTDIEISGTNKKINFSVLTKNQGVKNGSPEQLRRNYIYSPSQKN